MMFSAEMASTMMELTAEARTYWLGPWNPNYHVTMVLRKTMDRVSECYTLSPRYAIVIE